MKYKYTQTELERIAACPWLTARERRVFKMFYRKGMRIEDIAAELDVSGRTVNRDPKAIRNRIK